MKKAELLLEWVALKHYGQLIRKTAEPYLNHLTAVAGMVRDSVPCGYEIALCHDLLEDTNTTIAELSTVLLTFGYEKPESGRICDCVTELTDVYTAKAYPDLNKAERKEKEAARLLTISPPAQSVKYADLIYNIEWVIKYDQKHAKKYLKKKKRLLEDLNQGDHILHEQALALARTELQKLRSVSKK